MDDPAKKVSDFIVHSTVVDPVFNAHYHAGFDRIVVNFSPAAGDTQWLEISGSVSEFYIDPVVSSIGDLDLMHGYACLVAVFDDIFERSIMTQLLEEVKVYKIIKENEYPGYFYLRSNGILNYDWNLGRYLHVPNDCNRNLPNNVLRRGVRWHGPATINTNVGTVSKFCCWAADDLSMDDVKSIRCFTWPPDVMSDFSTRRRIHGWPSEGMIDAVVRNGCDLVPVSHPDVESTEMWRLSFSRAEMILIRSWTPIQQTVYHMIRLFAKRELKSKNGENIREILSNYHLKTLMLWSCESESHEWWESNSVIDICVRLIQKLKQWTEDKYCPS